MDAFFWALLTACIWGVVPVLEKIGLAKASPFTGLFYRCLGVLIGLILLGLFIVKPHELRSVDYKTVGVLILSGFLASFVAQMTFYHGLKIGQVSRVVPVSGTYPLIAFILSMIFLGESINLVKVIGIVLVVSGAWLLR